MSDEKNNPLTPTIYFDVLDRGVIKDGFDQLNKKLEKRLKILEGRGDGQSNEAIMITRKIDRMDSIRKALEPINFIRTR
ncbi:MAG: hypothetical protein ACEQSB_06365 [Undibacterium sp.]